MIVLLIASIGGWLVIFEGCSGSCGCRGRSAIRSRPCSPGVDDLGQREAHERIAGETVSERRARVAETMTQRQPVDPDEGGGGARESRRDLLGRAVHRTVRHGLGHHGQFRRDRAAKDTSLAVVAPGISEALATTAIGLAAAIPASIAFNRLGASMCAGPAAAIAPRSGPSNRAAASDQEACDGVRHVP